MRRLIATTAMALVMAGPAVSQMAEDQTMAEGGFYEVQMGDLFASELIGQEVYAARPAAEPGEMEEAEVAADEPPVDEAEVAADEAPTERTLTAAELGEMENIGQVSEIVFGRDGEVKAIAVGVGDRDVALSFDEIEFAADADDPAQVFIVTRTGADELENAPEFDRDAARRAEADPAMTPEEEDPAMAREEDPAVTEEERLAEDPAVTEERLAEERAVTEWRRDRDAMVPPQVEREGYVLAEVAEMSVDSLIGANVYDAADENIGSVSDVVVSAEGQLEYVVIDVGGFLGFGTHTVAIGFDEMTVLHDEGWADLRVYVDVTQDRLEAMPEYQGVAN